MFVSFRFEYPNGNNFRILLKFSGYEEGHVL